MAQDEAPGADGPMSTTVRQVWTSVWARLSVPAMLAAIYLMEPLMALGPAVAMLPDLMAMPIVPVLLILVVLARLALGAYRRRPAPGGPCAIIDG